MKHLSLKKIATVAIIVLLAAIAVRLSVFVEPLHERTQREKKGNFSPRELADDFWKHRRREALAAAIELGIFDSLLRTNAPFLKSHWGRTVGVASSHSFLVKGSLTTGGSGSDTWPVAMYGQTSYSLRVKHIFGNTVRNAVGCFNVDDFENTMDFNALSAELNARVASEIVAEGITSLPRSSTLRFTGALELHDGATPKELEIIPLKIERVR